MKKKIAKILSYVFAPVLILALVFGGVLFAGKQHSTTNMQAPTENNSKPYDWSEALASGFSVSENNEYELSEESSSVLINLSGDGYVAETEDVVHAAVTTPTAARMASAELHDKTADETVLPSNMLYAKLCGNNVDVVVRANGNDHYISASTDAEYVLGDLLTGGRGVAVNGTKIYVDQPKSANALVSTDLSDKGVAQTSSYSTNDARVATVTAGTITFSNATYGVAKPASGSNTTKTSGRAFYITGGASVTFDTVTIQNFNSTSNGTIGMAAGAGIHIDGGNIIKLKDTTIKDCSSTSYGGGLYAVRNNNSLPVPSIFVYGNTNFKNNSVGTGKDGGAIYCSYNYGQPSLYLGYSAYTSATTNTKTALTGEISGNSARHGGGISTTGHLYMASGKIKNNTANNNGGGVYVNYGKIDITGGEISGNTAGSNGGGIFRDSGTASNSFTISGTVSGGSMVVAGNTATNGGGGGIYSSVNLTLSGSVVIGDRSQRDANLIGGATL